MNKCETKERNSGIELLKIIAIILIVVSHIVQSLSEQPQLINIVYPANVFIELSKSTTNIQLVILQIMRYFGNLGNAIFFISSAWFLCDSRTIKFKKIISMIINVWIISILFLFIFQIIGIDMDKSLMVQSFFPTLFANNWYITLYILLYAVHPLLNIVIEQLDQRSLLSLCLISFLLYFGICFLRPGALFQSKIITYSVLYFCIGYVKKYASKYFLNIKLNKKILIISSMMNVGLILLTDVFGLIAGRYVSILGVQVLRWNSISNPFLIIISISLFNIFKNMQFTNKCINYISSQSLFIYIIHENLLFRTYMRPLVFIFIYEIIGYHNLLFWVILLAIILFVLSFFIATLYNESIKSIVECLANKLSEKLLFFNEKYVEKLKRVNK